MKTIKIQKRKNVQIRQGVFESNSSSTHSVTIRNKNRNDNKREVRELVKDNILYPDVLNDYTNTFSYDSSSTCCDTKDKKAAIVCNWVYYIIADCSYSEWIEQNKETVLAKVLQTFTKDCGYDGVDMDSLTDGFYPFPEYDSPTDLPHEIDTEEDVEELESALKKLVEIVLDENMIIEESDVEN